MGRGTGFGSVTQLNSGRWAARYTHNGQRHSPGATFRTRTEARAYLATVQADLTRGTYSTTDGQRGSETLHEYATTFLRTRPLKPSTLNLYANKLDRLILPALGPRQLRDLTPATIREWHAATDTGPTAKAQAYRILRTILGQAVKDELIDRNPCNLDGAANPQTPKRPTLPPEAVANIANNIPRHHRALILAGGFSGLRIGELLALTRADISMPPGKPITIDVNKTMYETADRTRHTGTPKTTAGTRTVTLPEFLRDELAEHLATYSQPGPGGLVFVNNDGRPLSRHAVQQAFKKAARAAGVDERAHFHDLRHTAGTMAAQTGASLPEVMNRLGHASKDMALIYLHATKEADERIAERLNSMAPASLRRA
jgi:integrase